MSRLLKSHHLDLDTPDPLAEEPIACRADAVAPAFVCSWTDRGLDVAWVYLGGELDVATAPQLEHTLGEPQLQARLVVLDLRGLAFIDAVGVRTIVNASIRSRRAGRRLVLLRGIPNVDRMFALARTGDDLEIGDLGTPSLAPLALHLEQEFA
jgi:anti-anti-sigma factor